MTDEILSATKGAERLGIRTPDLIRLTYERQIPYVVIEGVPHYRPADLDAYRLEHPLPEPTERTVTRGTSDIDPAADGHRAGLVADGLRDMSAIVETEQHRPDRGRPVVQIVDQLLDLYDTGDFVSQRTWDLIGELVLRIPDNDAVIYPPADAADERDHPDPAS